MSSLSGSQSRTEFILRRSVLFISHFSIHFLFGEGEAGGGCSIHWSIHLFSVIFGSKKVNFLIRLCSSQVMNSTFRPNRIQRLTLVTSEQFSLYILDFGQGRPIISKGNRIRWLCVFTHIHKSIKRWTLFGSKLSIYFFTQSKREQVKESLQRSILPSEGKNVLLPALSYISANKRFNSLRKSGYFLS